MHVMQENLYEEDVRDKARAANCIATLFRQAQHLEPLLSHATLLPTLARVLRDDGKRSVDLCMGIQSVWLVLSNFSQFHRLLIENQVGVLTMEILDLEIKRTEHRVKVTSVLVSDCACCCCEPPFATTCPRGTADNHLNSRLLACICLPQTVSHLSVHLSVYLFVGLSPASS